VTLETWAQALDVYQRYMKYVTGCAVMFRKGYIDVNQFTCRSSTKLESRPR
jgi:cyclopropane-fatty-acyl-phospholipid synthase